MSRFNEKVAVLGAGVMGAQIAAHLVNVKVPVVLFDLPAKEGQECAIATKGHRQPEKLKPSPLGVADDAELIQPANYEENMNGLLRLRPGDRGHCRAHGLEAGPVHEDRPHVAKHALLASNTSGLSITKLSEALPEALRHRFCGIHFSTRRATCRWWS